MLKREKKVVWQEEVPGFLVHSAIRGRKCTSYLMAFPLSVGAVHGERPS